MAVSKPFILFTHNIVSLLCLFSGFPFVNAGFVRGSNETDRLALLEFKAAITGDPFGALNSWNESAHFCEWVGVTCGRRHQRVTVLRIFHGKLLGSISPHIGNLSFLRALGLRNNSLTGEIPPELGRLRRLQKLTLSNNSISGEIPANISRCSNLFDLELSGNRLEGEIPGELGSLSKLEGLYIGRNNLVGGLPSTLGNLSSLEILFASDNKIGGNIPDTLGRLKKLKALGIGGNNLVGSIPLSIYNLSSVTLFGASDNNIQGSLPSNLGITLPNLEIFNLAANLFTGSIPKSLSNATKLNFLRFGHNYFSGIIPKEVGSLFSLEELELEYNNLSGPIPQEIGLLQYLVELHVSKNMLTGNIPSSFGSCLMLSVLKMDENKLWGILPSTLAILRGLEELDLSHNNFSGKIPGYLERFIFLKKLNLSFNDFDGEVPERGAFKNATAISIEGNKKLCGGIPELQLQSCNSEGSKNKRLTLTMKLITSISLGLLALLLTLCFLYLCWCKKRINLPSVKLLGNSFPQLSYQNLLKATDGFSSTNLLGVGSFGSVYKGILDEGQKIVAVKVLNLQFQGASKSFIAECKALKNIKHRNLLKIVTACASIDYQGNDFKALVYEFMVNGTLEQWLHPSNIGDDGHEEGRLNFLQRLNIAIDVASALDYLHHHCSEPIVHCDLKPSNILLDDEMIAHIGDFGLARFLLEATSKSSPNQSSSIGMRGTVGYAAPEYGMGNEVSEYGDVYSYGILLLEMFTGKRPTDSMFTDSLTLHKFVEMALLEQVENICDPTLFLEREMGEERSITQITDQNHSSYITNKIQNCLVSILKIAVACSHDLPTDRMGMNDVVAQLLGLKRVCFKMELVEAKGVLLLSGNDEQGFDIYKAF